jgi:hypothetical protein
MVKTEEKRLVIEIETNDPEMLRNELKNSIIGILQNIKYEESELLEIESSQYFLLMLLKEIME